MDKLHKIYNFIKSPSAYYKESVYGFFWHLDVISAIFGLKKVQFSSSGIVPINNYLKIIWSAIVLATLMLTQPVNHFWEDRSLTNNLIIIYDLTERISNTLIQFANSFYYVSTNALLYSTMDSIAKDFNIRSHDKRVTGFFYKSYFFSGITFIPFVILIVIEMYFKVAVYTYIFRIPGFIQMLHFVTHVCVITSFLRYLNSRLKKLWPENSLQMKSIQSAEEKLFQRPIFNEQHFDISVLMDVYDRLANCADLLMRIHGLQFLVSICAAFVTTVISITFVALNNGPSQTLADAVCFQNLASLLCACCVCDILYQEVQKTDLLVMRHLIRLKSDPVCCEKLSLFKQLVEKRQMRFSSFGLFCIDYGLLLTLLVSAITYAVVAIQIITPHN